MKKLLLSVILTSTMGVAMAQAGYTSSNVGTSGVINNGATEFDGNPPGNMVSPGNADTYGGSMGNSGSYGSSTRGSSANMEGKGNQYGPGSTGSSMQGTGQYNGPNSRGNGADSAYTYSRGGVTNPNSPGNLNDPIVQRRGNMHGNAGTSMDAGTSVPSIQTQPQTLSPSSEMPGR